MANLVIGADGVGMDPSEVIAQAGEQRPGIEDQDINDGWLIEHTETLDAGPGMMKYKIVLPDGSPLECTPFQIEQRRDMSKVWMATVRATIVGNAAAAAEVGRAQALKARRDKQMQGAGISIAGQMPTAEEAAQLAAAVKQAPPPPPESARAVIAAIAATPVEAPVSEDPEAYAKRMLQQYLAEHEHWQALQQKATRNAKTAQKAVLKWQTVLAAISDDQEPEAVASVRTPVATRAERAVRTLQTSVIATSK